MGSNFDKTLNLPQTDFEMRAGLPQREPGFLQKWQESDIYSEILKNNKEKPLYVLHDGPPFANGDIHIGHALNKILKDFVVRYKNMSGFRAPYIPGWDMHGLPIELQAIKKIGINRANTSVLEFRKQCREFSLGYVANQKEQFKRLGVMGDWDNPYLTADPDFESKQIELFGEMAKRGHIYKGLRPVHWCPHDETALAEAEIEYAEDPCDSIYVKFKVNDDKGKLNHLTGGLPVYFVIWTTTTWTIPGNVAICVGPEFEYSLVKANNEIYIIAAALVENVMNTAKIENYEEISKFKGADFEYMTVKHPFLDRDSLLIVGDHVSLETGTGCVHTAPGHGIEDFIVCQNYKQIPVVVPVDDKGIMTKEAGKFEGLTFEKANKAIEEELKASNSLLAFEKIIHQYPHCWRCQSPVIFRATEQWFCSIDGFKDEAIEEIKKVKWIPLWGEERIISMVRDRSDWCISRQRFWGVPIPIFYCEKCGKMLLNDTTIKAVSSLFKKEGSDAWYKYSAKEILNDSVKCECGGSEFTKETDIMDVWLDSGSSHSAVMDTRKELAWPCDLYLEGNDQYRGWFQSSLLTAVAWRGKAPYKTVLTHGFIVDLEGKKMSKSIGNVIDPLVVIKEYGADILRLWVASADYKVDIRISKEILKQLSEVYRKIRNTSRFILSNLYDYSPSNDTVSYDDMPEIDKWALLRLNRLIENVRNAYENFEYYVIFHAIHNFCVVDMSNFYLDVLKDRLYTEKPDSHSRRSAQTTIYTILDALVKMIAPILCFTAEDIWNFMPQKDKASSIFLTEIPKPQNKYENKDLGEKWENILLIREDVKKELEKARVDKIIGSSLDAKVTIFSEGKTNDFLNSISSLLKAILIVSDVEIINGSLDNGVKYDYPKLSVKVEQAKGVKCQRCWSYSETVGQNEKNSELCERCAGIIG